MNILKKSNHSRLLLISLFSLEAWSLEALQNTLHLKDLNDPFAAEENPTWNPNENGENPWSIQYSRLESTQLPIGPTEVRNRNLAAFGFRNRYFGALARAAFDRNGIFLMDTGDSTVAKSAYLHRHSQPEIFVFTQSKFTTQHWDFGFVLQTLYQIETQADILMAETPPRGRIQAKAKPVLRPILGAQYEISESQSMSLKYSEAAKTSVSGDLSTNIPVGSFVSLNYLASFGAKPLYLPRALSFQWQKQWNATQTIGAQVEYSHWADMPPPYLSLSKSVPYMSLWVPDFRPLNTWTFAVGHAWKVAPNRELLSSLGFMQSPFHNLKILYYDDHSVQGGLGYRLDSYHASLKMIWHLSQKQVAPTYFALTLGLLN